jgi:hypothetical protein
MSERAGKPKRASRKVVRVWAWTVGALSFLSPWVLFNSWPKPAFSAASAAPTTTTPQRPVVIVVTKKIVYTKSPSSSVSTSGGGPVQYVSAPSAPSVATSCGTHAC